MPSKSDALLPGFYKKGMVISMDELQNLTFVQDADDNGELDKQYLTFWTDKQLFGVKIATVVQIISIQEITPIPDAPDYAKGVINLRGNIIPVIDVRVRFGKPEVPYGEHTCIIVTNIDDTYIGFIVDLVDEVTTIEEDQISPPPKVSKERSNPYLIGIGKVDDKVVMLVDTAKILSESELVIVEDAVAADETSAEEEVPAKEEVEKVKTAKPKKKEPPKEETSAQ